MRLTCFLCVLSLANLSKSANLGRQEHDEDETVPTPAITLDCALRETAIQVDACYLEKRDFRCHNRYKERECGNNRCLLGYVTDADGCVIRCECASTGKLEVDIKVDGQEELEEMEEEYGIRPQSKDIAIRRRKWNRLIQPDGTCVIPFRVSPGIKRNDRASAAILAAMSAYHKETRIRFKPREGNQQHLYFTMQGGCWSYIGRSKKANAQEISIGRGCEYAGIVIHEIMHALGFFHEQSRPDRDSHVQIIYENILSGMARNFAKKTRVDVNSMGSPYDTKSIMHYGWRDFSKNGKPTILDRQTRKPIRKQRKYFSTEDLVQLNKVYPCNPPTK